jgi:hypothetical protein
MKKIFIARWRQASCLAVLLLNFNFHAAGAALANVWHIPDGTGDVGVNMRNPEFAIGTSSTVTFYTGAWKWDSGNGYAQRCNQTNGILYYKTTSQSTWSSLPLMFYSNTSVNQYWFTNLNCAQFNYNDTVQYFFFLGFDGSGSAGSTNTWLCASSPGSNSGSSVVAASNSAAASPFAFSVTNTFVGTPVFTVNGQDANYSTEHLFVDEVAGDSIPINVTFSPTADNVVEADVFSNLNRRNRAAMDANGDGIEDGIIPPDGNLIPTGDDNNYYKACAMTNLGGGRFWVDALCDELRRVSPHRALQGGRKHECLALVFRQWPPRPLHRRDAAPGAQHDDV